MNVASAAGISEVSAQNAAFSDLDGDGYPDLILGNTQAGRSNAVFLNRPKDGGRGFTDFTAQSGINSNPVSTGPRAADFVALGDVNNDGCVDMFSAKYSEFEKPKSDPRTEKALRDEKGNILYEKTDDGLRSEILLNDCYGHFSILPNSGVGGHAETTTSAEFFDYDDDGILDLFTGNWYKEYGVSYLSYPSRLYKGLGDGRFKEVTEKAGLLTYATEGSTDSSRPVYGVSHCDYNNDGAQDILVAVYGRQANRLWKNNGDGTFTDVAPAAGFDGDAIRHGRYPADAKRAPEPAWRSHGNTFSAACADYDNDGDMDVFLGEITHSWAGEASDLSSLLENLGAKKNYVFRRRPEAIKRVHNGKNWNQGDMRAAWFDFDNDGLLDLLISSGDYPDGQYLRLFRQVKKGVFAEVTDKCGFNWESSAGITLADYDRDGAVDILAGKSWMRLPAARRQGKLPAPALFRNLAGTKNNWLEVTLEGKGPGGASRSAIGARITLKTGGTEQLREIQGAGGHAGQVNSFTAHFGLGRAAKADRLEVRWGGPGRVSTFYGVPANRFVTIKEGSGEILLTAR